MAKIVTLNIKNGNFDSGFDVQIDVIDETGKEQSSFQGYLPPHGTIDEDLKIWQQSYTSLPNIRGTFLGATAITPNQCQEAADNLKRSFIDWLNSSDEKFQDFKEDLYHHLGRTNEEIRFILKTSHPTLPYLPWTEWSFFSKKYPRAELAISPINYQNVDSINHCKLRILAILGNSEGIDIEQDKNTLKSFESSKVYIKFLPEPQYTEITNELWDSKWSLLFFSGHSSSKNGEGKIFINKNDSLTIKELKYGLRKSIDNGLKLLIFNSCDGLLLAKDVSELNIPHVIFMREPVPDIVAQRFLKFFLKAFARGESLFLAVREARERLCEAGFDKEFPNASWLPILYSNPTAKPLTWKELQGDTSDDLKDGDVKQFPVENNYTSNKSTKWFKPILITVVLVVVLLSGWFLLKDIPTLFPVTFVPNTTIVDKNNNEELEQAKAFLLGYFLWTIPLKNEKQIDKEQITLLEKISKYLKCTYKNSDVKLDKNNLLFKATQENKEIINKIKSKETSKAIEISIDAKKYSRLNNFSSIFNNDSNNPFKIPKHAISHFMAGGNILSYSIENKENIGIVIQKLNKENFAYKQEGFFYNTKDFAKYIIEYFINEIKQNTECSF